MVLFKHGLEVVKSLDFTAPMSCGSPAIYQKNGFQGLPLVIQKKDDSVEDPDRCIFTVELAPVGFDGANRPLGYLYYYFLREENEKECK